MKNIKLRLIDFMKEWKIDWSGKAHNFNDDEIEFIIQVIRECDPLTQGKYLQLFESNLKKYLGIESGEVLAVNSGTSGLELSAILSHIEEGDEVIIPAHTFCATALPFLRRGAKIIWADIDPDTFVMSIEDVEKKITVKTKCVIPVHLYGVPVEMDSLLSLQKQFDFLLVEDCAQAMGSSYKNKKVGSFGDFSILSFHGQKNMTTFGEGGAVVLKSPALVDKAKGLRSFGSVPFDGQENDSYWIPAMSNVTSIVDWELPHKFTISEIQCAIGVKLLERLDSLNKLRKNRFEKFKKSLKEFPEIKFQKVYANSESSYHLLPVKYEGLKNGIKAGRDDLIRLLAFKYKIKAIVQYYPLYRYDLFKKWGCSDAICPNTDEFFDNMVSFPFHIWMDEDKFDYMIESTKKALTELRGLK